MTGTPASRPLRADLHVHSTASGFTDQMRIFRSRDCFSSPETVYRTARARGMDLVAITDHDSIDGCLELLNRQPDATDIIMGEEIECRIPGTRSLVHLGALGLSERDHHDVQPLRGSVFDAAAFLRSQGVAVVLHHPVHLLRDRLDVRGYLERILPLVHAVEVRNATMMAAHNDLAAAITGAWNRAGGHARVGQTGGSDAHVLRHIGTAFTESPGRTREEFLGSLKRGESRALGVHGTTRRLAVEIYGVILNYWAALLGWGSSGLTGAERAVRIGLSILSVPFQFTPILVSLAQKRTEGRRVAEWRERLGL